MQKEKAYIPSFWNLYSCVFNMEKIPLQHILTEQQTTKENLIKMQSIAERHLELDDAHDPLLAINFAR